MFLQSKMLSESQPQLNLDLEIEALFRTMHPNMEGTEIINNIIQVLRNWRKSN